MTPEIPKASQFAEAVFKVTENTFTDVALALFRFQYASNPVYRAYCDALKIQPRSVNNIESIPFLPVSFFKTHNVTCLPNSITNLYFESSGTTGMHTSRHLVADVNLYQQSFFKTFLQFYGPVSDYCILGLLPSYLERQHSSLVFMVNQLIAESNNTHSGFYLNNTEALAATLKTLEEKGQKTILFGVTYALLDFADAYPMPLKHTTIIETGGMKGRKKELLRAEVHELLKKAFSLLAIHSEYGMTELLSQAYAQQNGLFTAPAWMRILIREEDDPFAVTGTQKSGGINIIDLANIYSCAFIATEDVGTLHANGTFEISGRFDAAEVRGCSLLVI